MKESKILKAAIIEQVHYTSPDAMYRILARAKTYGRDVKYLSIIHQDDGSVIALIQFPYNDKEMFERSNLIDVLKNG